MTFLLAGRCLVSCASACLAASVAFAAGSKVEHAELWSEARKSASIHAFSTLFTAQDVQRWLSTPEGLEKALSWCKDSGVTKVYLETFRGNYQAEKSVLEKARDKFRSMGFAVSGCVTTTKVGKRSTEWGEEISCYTDLPTQQKLQAVFEYAAGLFDEIMIDDFWFTDCTCEQCNASRKARLVRIGPKSYPVPSDSWDDYRCELMVRLSEDRVLAASKRVNPKARLIIKYPQWYDKFQERGYEVIRETKAFDRIWVGTETRNYDDLRWGGTPQYEGYFIMRWLGGLGGGKCGGGWYDPFGTTQATYVEQARQTILGGARESMLFCYGALQRETGPANVEALRANIPELLAVAKQIRSRDIVGISAYKPANSAPGSEPRVFDFVGMLGLPLAPCHDFPAKAPAAFFSLHALKDPGFQDKLATYIRTGKPVLVTDGLVNALTNCVELGKPNVCVLNIKGHPKVLLDLTQDELDVLRVPLLKSLKASFKGPNGVGLYLFKDKSWVIENFKDEPVRVEFNGTSMSIPARQWKYSWN